jgi:hypothetical protein
MIKKKNKVLEKCHFCQCDLTGVIQCADDKKCCYKCFILWRKENAKRKKSEEDNKIINEIRRKKFWCPKCKELKNDIEVIWYHSGYMCGKCGNDLTL